MAKTNAYRRPSDIDINKVPCILDVKDLPEFNKFIEIVCIRIATFYKCAGRNDVRTILERYGFHFMQAARIAKRSGKTKELMNNIVSSNTMTDWHCLFWGDMKEYRGILGRIHKLIGREFGVRPSIAKKLFQQANHNLLYLYHNFLAAKYLSVDPVLFANGSTYDQAGFEFTLTVDMMRRHETMGHFQNGGIIPVHPECAKKKLGESLTDEPTAFKASNFSDLDLSNLMKPTADDSPTKPPIGIMPEYIFRSKQNVDRVVNLCETILRYANAGRPVEAKWLDELSRRATAWGTDILKMQGKETD